MPTYRPENERLTCGDCGDLAAEVVVCAEHQEPLAIECRSCGETTRVSLGPLGHCGW